MKRSRLPIIICLILSVALIVGAAVSCVFPPKKSVATTFATKDLYHLPDIYPGDTATQTFTPTADYERFGILFTNLGQLFTSGTLDATISSAATEPTLLQRDLNSLSDLAYAYFDYSLSAGEEYQISITTSGTDLAISLLDSRPDPLPAQLTFNGEAMNSSIIMSFVSRRNDYFVLWYYVTGLALIACFLILYSKKEVYDHKKTKRA